MPSSRKPLSDKSAERDRQLENFKEAARELGCAESEERFQETLRKIVKQKRKAAKSKKHYKRLGDM
jgi:16S rRNA C1402 (ribose-2'-O) methylase RsmI